MPYDSPIPIHQIREDCESNLFRVAFADVTPYGTPAGRGLKQTTESNNDIAYIKPWHGLF